MSHDVETLASKEGLTVTEYVLKIIAKTIGDAYDYRRCMELIDDDSETVSMDGIMKRYEYIDDPHLNRP